MSVFDYPAMLFRQLFSNKKEKTLYIKEIGWTITIPKNFEVLSDKKMESHNKKGMFLLEAITQQKINYPGKNKFCAIYELQNVFSCDITDLNDTSENLWEKQLDDLHNRMLSALYISYKDFAHVKIATETDARQKGNIIFKTYEIIITSQHRELDRLRYFYTVYKNYGIHITMAFTEPAVGEQMLDALRASTFSG